MKLKYVIGLAVLLSSNLALADNTNCSSLLNQPVTKNNITQYNHCVDLDIQQLYAQMLKTGNYPLMGANGDFRDFTTALYNFTALATHNKTQQDYAQLYQKQFKLLFYADYITNTSDPLIKQLKSKQLPSVKILKADFEKALLNYPTAQRKKLSDAFTQMISQSSFGQMHQKYVYAYALAILHLQNQTHPQLEQILF